MASPEFPFGSTSYDGNTLYFGRVNLCHRTLRLANLSVTLWCSIPSSKSLLEGLVQVKLLGM